VLAEEFGVSRNTIRSARKVLESRNLVETKWGSGTVVLEADKAARNMVLKLSKAQHEWKNVMQLRDLVEPHIVELAAVTASASDLITLGDLIDRTNPHMLPEESLNLDMTFHLALAQSTGNPLIEALLGFVNDSTRKVRLHTHETYAKRELSLQGHARIFDCIRHGDSQGAGQAMQRHLREVGEFAL
jgi:GntR family transcriptional repressor for pyruvate dehydrogenase complex